MLLRVKALYERDNRAIVFMVTVLFIVELTVNAWLLKYGHGTFASRRNAINHLHLFAAVTHSSSIHGTYDGLFARQ